ncbi:MAG: riboflavin biosynthesis protein RibF, partial [Clostridiales bacterium]|nr:riboflavin biosynthesis protein RibF [Clostridiales bacterium]
LREKCAQLGIGCEIVGMVELDGQQIHSTLIRDLITTGEMEQANRYLGHPHMLTNRVGQGKHLGRTLGFPTVNLRFPPGVLAPARGVYATKVYVEGRCYIAVTNVGVRPTVEDTGQVNVEAFLLDFSGDLYGKELRVEFYRHLRGERKFPSVEALRAEVMRNAQQTRDYFAERG